MISLVELSRMDLFGSELRRYRDWDRESKLYTCDSALISIFQGCGEMPSTHIRVDYYYSVLSIGSRHVGLVIDWWREISKVRFSEIDLDLDRTTLSTTVNTARTELTLKTEIKKYSFTMSGACRDHFFFFWWIWWWVGIFTTVGMD